MDVDAKRKYCGLLMFDVPTISSSKSTKNCDSMREVDHSSSFESQRNLNSLDHQFVMQDGLSEFSSSNRALAAGAAAGESHDVTSTDNDTTGSKSQPQKRTPRPPNAFILYRREKQPAIIASQRNLTNAEVSRTISDMWRKEPEEIRLEWERYADRKKLEHMQTYPNYVYRPNKNKSKVDKRRNQQRRQNSKESINNNSVDKSQSAGPVRRKSTKSSIGNVKPPSKLDLPLMVGFNMQQSNSNSVTPTSAYSSILPSPEMPLLSTHFTTDNPEEFVSPVTPITPHAAPLTPPEHDFKVSSNHQQLLRLVPSEELAYQQQHQQHQQHQGNASQFPFQTISELSHFHNNDQLFCFVPGVPDVEQQQQQMIAEIMLHHEPHHHITPTATVPSSNPAYYPTGGSYTEMLGFEFQNYSGLDASDQYLQ